MSATDATEFAGRGSYSAGLFAVRTWPNARLEIDPAGVSFLRRGAPWDSFRTHRFMHHDEISRVELVRGLYGHGIRLHARGQRAITFWTLRRANHAIEVLRRRGHSPVDGGFLAFG